MNDLALSAVKDAHEELRKSPRYKHLVKKNAKAAERAGEEYERILYLEMQNNQAGDRRGFLMDYMDTWQENMKHDTDIFAFSVQRYLTKLGYKDNTLMTLVFVAHVLTDYACQLWDFFWNVCKEQTGVDHSEIYRNARLTPVFNYWGEVTRSFDPHNRIHIDDDPDCKMAFDIIERKAISSSTINLVGDKALELNHDIRQWADEQVKIEKLSSKLD